MARKIHYNREEVDLAIGFNGELGELKKLLAAAVEDGKTVRLAEESSGLHTYTVHSWVGMNLGSFIVDMRATDTGIDISSSLVQSVLHSTNILPFVFGKGSPQAPGGYQAATKRVTETVLAYNNKVV